MEFMTIGDSTALGYASKALREVGWIHTNCANTVILPVPSLETDGSVKGGGNLSDIPDGALVVGGKLELLRQIGYRVLDLLTHPLYLSENAAITAHCALQVAMERLPITFQECPVLVIGWGRIGKCLVRLLRLLGAKVTVAARKESDRALITALGYHSIDLDGDPDLSSFRVIFNTADAQVLTPAKLSNCRNDCLKIDLASTRGIESADAVWARGLPNAQAPESSGNLIAKIILKEVTE